MSRVLISRNKKHPDPFRCNFDNCLHALKKEMNCLCLFPWLANGQPLLLSTLGGQIGIHDSKKLNILKTLRLASCKPNRSVNLVQVAMPLWVGVCGEGGGIG